MRSELVSIATEAFEKIIASEERWDSIPRTGIQVLVRQPDSRNQINFSVKEPSELAKTLVVEKAVRSWMYMQRTSQNSADEKRLRFAGSITVDADELPAEGLDEDELNLWFQVSVDDLLEEEDVAVAILLMSKLLKIPPTVVIQDLKENGGQLPECLDDKNHYLSRFLGS